MSAMEFFNLDNLQSKIDYSFKRKSLLKNALSHPHFGGNGEFERLEFLGDRILALVIAESIFSYYSDEAEGFLAKRLAFLTSRAQCFEVALTIDLGSCLPISAKDLSNTSILSNTIESLIAAIYIDGGLEAARVFILKFWKEYIRTSLQQQLNPKSQLQEWAQQHHQQLPVYTLLTCVGSDHSPVYEFKVSVGDLKAKGSGKNKKQAELDAANNFLNSHKHLF